MQTIITKYLPITNTKGGRIMAKCEGGTVIIPDDHSLDTEGMHAKAAITLANKLGWKGELISGSYKHDFYFNFLDSNKHLIK